MNPAPTELSHPILRHVRHRKYLILLSSFLLLIFADTFSDIRLVNVAAIYQNMLVGLLVFFPRPRTRTVIIALIAASFFLDLLEAQHVFTDGRAMHGFIYLNYFALVSGQAYREGLYSDRVTRELLSAAPGGFVLLCLIATFLFSMVEAGYPGSFSTIGTGQHVLENLHYFSFVTLLTIGYGDIVPLLLVAKRAVMLAGLTGHFYPVFITSIIVGKYPSAKELF